MEIQKSTRVGVILLAIGATLVALSCGGKQSMASKSATAYREAVAKGIPVGSGEHGGHTAARSTAEPGGGPDNMAGMDHSQMPGMHTDTASGGQHGMSSMNHGSMPGMNHSQMQHTTSPAMASMPGMQHGSMAGMAGMDHSKKQHGSTGSMANMPGMQHGSMSGMTTGMQHGATAVAPVPPAPTNSSGIAQLNPSATLRPDAFDQPAPMAISEANKAGAEGGPTMQQPSSSPQPKPPDHSHHGANSNRE